MPQGTIFLFRQKYGKEATSSAQVSHVNLPAHGQVHALCRASSQNKNYVFVLYAVSLWNLFPKTNSTATETELAKSVR